MNHLFIKRSVKIQYIHSVILKNDNQQRPIVPHKEFCSMLCGSLGGREFEGEWIHAYVWLSPFAIHPRHHNSVN